MQISGCKRSMLLLPWGLWAADGEAQPQVVRLYQDPFPEGQEAVTHSTTHQPQPTDLQICNRLKSDRIFHVFIAANWWIQVLTRSQLIQKSLYQTFTKSVIKNLVCSKKYCFFFNTFHYFHRWNFSVSLWSKSTQKVHHVTEDKMTK